MTHVQRTFTVKQPIDTVVAYLEDFAHAESWDPGTVTCTQTSPGEVRRRHDLAQRLRDPRPRDRAVLPSSPTPTRTG